MPVTHHTTPAIESQLRPLDASQLIRADWPAPAHVQAWVSTRAGGISAAPFDALNVGDHVGDAAEAVAQNRRQLTQFCQARGSIGELQWLNQVHGTSVFEPTPAPSAPASLSAVTSSAPCADASSTTQAGLALVVMTADCLPVFFTNRDGSRVAVAHAGWRGLCHGVLEATAATFAASDTLMAWLGPAIGPESFEVGESVRDAFLAAAYDRERATTEAAFVATTPAHYLADLYALARLRLLRGGVSAVYGGGCDTMRESSRFFSYRREASTGRMANVIWHNGMSE